MEIYEIKQKEEKRRRVGKHHFSDIMLFLSLHYITLNVKEIITVVYFHEFGYCIFWVYDCFDFMIKNKGDILSYL